MTDLTRVKSVRACLPMGRRVPRPPSQARPCVPPKPAAASVLRLRSGPEDTGVLPLTARRACLRKHKRNRPGGPQWHRPTPHANSAFLPRLAKTGRDAPATRTCACAPGGPHPPTDQRPIARPGPLPARRGESRHRGGRAGAPRGRAASKPPAPSRSAIVAPGQSRPAHIARPRRLR